MANDVIVYMLCIDRHDSISQKTSQIEVPVKSAITSLPAHDSLVVIDRLKG